VAAGEVEGPVLQALRQHRPDLADAEGRELIESCVDRVVLHPTAIEITVRGPRSPSERAEIVEPPAGTDHPKLVRIPWVRAATKRRREIILPEQPKVCDHRPIRAESRATLVRSIALGRRWLDELISGTMATAQAIAQREGCSQRHVERTLSLAFLPPDLVQAAVEGRLPRGVGVSRLIDPPVEWPRQWRMLGLQP
jgi:hypothetical protein